jgi:hypothetical protein
MIRCYMGVDKVVGFGHQLIKALIEHPLRGRIHRRPNPVRASCTVPMPSHSSCYGRRWRRNGYPR